jgi:hypothetical protein
MRQYNNKVIVALAALVMIAAATFTACKKNNDTGGNTNNTVQFDNSATVTASISGQLFDENGLPLAGATVSTGNHSFTTSANGLFYFKNISCKQKAQLLTISKTGYYVGYRTLQIRKGEDNFTRVRVLKMDNAQSFATNAVATIAAAGGASVKFDANSIVNKSTNAAYNGTATIYAKTIRANDANIEQLVPGALRGIATGGEENYLTTYGMLAVEMFDQTGAALQIAPGKTAEIHMPIEANQLASAPSEIPLGFFDAVSGMWKQEGSAKKVGGEYVGKVQHFSYWSFYYGGPLCNFDVTFIESVTGNALSGFKVKLISSSTTNAGYEFTNASGNISCGYIPASSSFTLELMDAVCNTTIYTTTFSTTTTALSLGTIAVTLPSTSAVTISGTVIDCGGLALGNSLVFIDLGLGINVPVTPNTTGAFSWSGVICSSPTIANITAYDLSTSVNGIATASIVTGANAIGNIAACGTINQFLTMSINDGTTIRNFSFVEPICNFISAQSGGNTTLNSYQYIVSGGTTIGNGSSFTFDGTNSGSFNLTSIEANEYTSTTSWHTRDSMLTSGSIPITITSYGSAVGTFINGTFSGTYLDAITASTYTVSGSMAVKRDF